MSGLLFALLNVFTLIPAQHLNSYVMAFLRYFFGALFLLPIVLQLGLIASLRTRRLPLHLFRGAIHTAGMILWFVGLPLTTPGRDHRAGLHRTDLRHHRRGAVPGRGRAPAALDRRRWSALPAP